jgi:hypothetical protein
MLMKRTISRGDEIVISEHAKRRAQQRGVSVDGVVVAALYGEVLRAIGASERRTVTRKVTAKLQEQGMSPRLAESLLGTVVITKDRPDGRHVVTVRPSERSGRRRGGVHKPKHGRSDRSKGFMEAFELVSIPNENFALAA